VKKLIVMVIALCSAVSCRTPEDTEPARKWRLSEARLTGGGEWRPYKKAQRRGLCEEVIDTREKARRAIADQPQCIASAIALLRGLPPDDQVLSDLAAAYYTRAQVEGRDKFLLDAWRAVQGVDLPEARFNRALIQEALGRFDDARRSWDACQAGDAGQWGREAREHRDRLTKELNNPASEQWPRNRDRLAAALAGGDRAAVALLIRDYPTPAENYLYDVLLDQWARSGSRKDLDAAQLLAGEVAKVQKDPFAAEVVAAITKASDNRLLRAAHREYAWARRAELAFERVEAIERYKHAATLFARGPSPLLLVVDMALATNRLLQEGANVNDSIARLEARAAAYPHQAARVVATHAFVLNDAGNHIDALAKYDQALRSYNDLRDFDYVAQMQSAKSGVLFELGQIEQAWSEALATNRYASKLVEVRGRHVRLGALSMAAMALGYPDVAILYQDEGIEAIRGAFPESPADLDLIKSVNHHLSIAYRRRAEIEIGLARYAAAQQDLAEAGSLADQEDKEERTSRNDLQGQIAEVEGKLLLSSDPDRAVKAFTEAIDQLGKGELPNVRTSLLSRRAKAYRQTGERKKAEADLREALKGLDREERLQLQKRRRGQGEDIWSPFFDRFRETYRQLIDLIAADGNKEEAFAYAERAKAFEPLDLVLRLPFAPKRFRELTKGNQPIALKDVQAELPADTYLFEYCVLEDRTLVWVIHHDRVRMLPLDVTRADIARWRAEVQEAVEEGDDGRLGRSLSLPYLALVAPALKEIPRRTLPRIVIIPDGDMHGLPFGAMRDPLTRRYLFQDAILAVDGSATLYIYSLLRDPELRSGNSSALLIGDPRFNRFLPDAYRLPRLEGAREEVEEAAKLYPDPKTRTDSEATVPEFLRLAGSAEVIHLAMHAVVNEYDPTHSFMLFAPTPDDSGKLDVQKLADLRLAQTRLVVLAGCSSAGGAPVGPEGVAPLVRPFVGAGVPGIVGSLWRISDATAKQLLVSFHRHYRAQGKDAAKALHEAQLDVLMKQPIRAWAPFEVIGYASSPGPASAANTKEKEPP
jgi:CHAT domain-containing protein